MRAASGLILCLTPFKSYRDRVVRQGYKVLEVKSVKKALSTLKKHPDVKVILSDSVDDFEAIKREYPQPVRILFIDNIDLTVTQEAINRGEVFRFVLDSSNWKTISQAIDQGANHFDIVHKHRSLIQNLKKQNRKLEKFIESLEKQVSSKTNVLKSIESELNQSKRYLEQLNALIAWINASTTVEELQMRIEKALTGILPIERVILSEKTTEKFVESVKKIGKPSIVIPLIYQKKNLGHLYFICKDEKTIDIISERLDLIKQIADTVSLTLEKIHIFDESVKRKQEWQKTFDAIKDPVALINKDYDIIRANMTYSQISGIKIQNLVGQKCYKVFQKRNRSCEGCTLQKALSNKKYMSFDLQSRAQETNYTTSSFPITPYDQGLVVMYYRDQGDEARLRDQLIQSEKMAEIGILAGSVAHEINNPLGGIIAFTQILLSEVSKETTMYQDLKDIEKAALRSKHIVENLLFFSRASRQQDRERMDILAILDKAISLVNLKTRHRNIHIKRSYANIPKVYGDFNQLLQTFLNFLQNSVEAIQKNGVIQIATRYLFSEKRVVIEIQDNGRGIGRTEISKVFNPFFTTKNKTKHAGLGLSVGYRIIKDHGGDVKVESQPGKEARKEAGKEAEKEDRVTKFVISLPTEPTNS